MNDVNKKCIIPADRGCIYEFIETDGTVKNYVLVISSNIRSMDKLISILMLGDSKSGFDVIPIDLMGSIKYVHCGLVTYAARARLGKKIGMVNMDVMGIIDNEIRRNLGIENTDMVSYKSLYEDLINKITSKETV